MSIKISNRHEPKRRKLSHSSDDEELTSKVSSSNRIGATRSSGTNGATPQSISKNQRSSIAQKSPMATNAGGVTRSSLMQLQVNELLEQIRPDYERRLRKLKSTSDELVQVIKSIPERPPLLPVDAEKALRKECGISIPFTDHRPDPSAKHKFEYKQPDCVNLRGGLFHRLGTKDDLSLEVAVQMPSALFQKKDYLNHRALHKRAYYMACLAVGIKATFEDNFDLQYTLLDGNTLIPIITMKKRTESGIKAAQNITILINVVFPSGFWPLEKMLPSRNCVRSSAAGETESTGHDLPTPFYNSNVCVLASSARFDQLIADTVSKCGSFLDACALGQTWLGQRGISSETSKGGFGLLDWAYMCALLLSGGGHKGHPLFSDRYSSVQLFKAMLQVLATRDLTDPLVIGSSNLQLEKGDLPILFDEATGVNALSKMSQWSYDLLRYQARLSLAAINARAADNFEPSFIMKVAEPSLQFDEIYTINTKAFIGPGLSTPERLATKIYTVLKRGLGDRITLIDLKWTTKLDWDLSSSAAKQRKGQQVLEICLCCNPETTSRLIDHGPTAEEQEAARDFREFWGEKAELRRFRDGSITEALVWSANTPVTLQTIQYLVAYHFKIPPSSIDGKTPDLESEHLSSSAPVSAEDAFKLINTRFQELSSKLHQMEGLPLSIRSVSPSGQALCSASIGHPLDPATTAPIDIIIQFDSSGRWPDHLLAIQHTKIAFLAKISDLVKESDSTLTTRIGLENTEVSSTGYYNTSFLDIVAPSPAPGLSPMVFRLRVHHERELQLLQALHNDKSLSHPSRDLVILALTEHKRTFVSLPGHTAAIRNLITHFQPLSTTIRLLKSWIAAHNLSNHIPDPVLEIIAARTFLQPYPWSTPGNATTAFQRCLHFLSSWDWVSSPLIVDLSVSQDLTSTQLAALETRFQAWRKLDPNMNTIAWFIGTNVDDTGTIWTQGARPAKVVAGRVNALARAAIDLIKSNGINMQHEDWNSLFMSPVSDFDFVIHLKSSVVRGGKKRGKKNGEVKFKNLQVHEDLDVDSIGHDVVSLYLADLEKAFAGAVLFFHGEGGKQIAGLWRPSVNERKEWRVRLGYSAVPYAGSVDDETEDKEMAVVNKNGMLTEMALLGEGMIEKIAVK